MLIVNTDRLDVAAAGLVLAVPLTRTDRGIPLHVPLEPAESGADRRSVIMCEQLRSLSTERLKKKMGEVPEATMRRVENVLRLLLDL